MQLLDSRGCRRARPAGSTARKVGYRRPPSSRPSVKRLQRATAGPACAGASGYTCWSRRMNKKALSERDICSKFISPAITQSGWDEMSQVREEVGFTKGRIIVRGKLVTRGKAKRADYILYYKPNIPIAIIEAKDNNHSVGDGMQQALEYAVTLDIPFVFSSNGDGFVFQDRTGLGAEKEAHLGLHEFPTPHELWTRYCTSKRLTPDAERLVVQDYYDDGSGRL